MIDIKLLACQFLIGLSRSMILFMVAAGLTLIFGVLKIINFAHGSLYMIGAYLCYSIYSFLGESQLGFWMALVFAPIGVAIITYAMERGLLDKLYGKEHLLQMLLTFGLVLVFGDLVKMIWGVEYRSVAAPDFLTGSFMILGYPFPKYNLLILILGPITAISMWFLLTKTKIGKMARAAATDREMVSALGIDVNKVFSRVFVFGGWLAGLGGALMAPMVNITPGMDTSIIIKAFLVVIIGGLGNVWGALVASLLVGVLESFGILFWPRFAITFPFILGGIVLIIKPSGLLKSTW